MSKKILKEAIEEAECLILEKGFGALKKAEGKSQISCADSKKLLGSVNIDHDCSTAYPNDNRWDYLVALSKGETVTAHYIEVHPASTGEVSAMQKKLAWLKAFVAKQDKLSKLTASYYWVASGRYRIPRHTPQAKQLANLNKDGLHGPTSTLSLK